MTVVGCSRHGFGWHHLFLSPLCGKVKGVYRKPYGLEVMTVRYVYMLPSRAGLEHPEIGGMVSEVSTPQAMGTVSVPSEQIS